MDTNTHTLTYMHTRAQTHAHTNTDLHTLDNFFTRHIISGGYTAPSTRAYKLSAMDG